MVMIIQLTQRFKSNDRTVHSYRTKDLESRQFATKSVHSIVNEK